MPIHADINLGATIKMEDAKRQAKTTNRLLDLLDTQPGVILADEVGMGKTFVALATALSYVANLKQNRRILILTPSIELKNKWDKDIDTFRDRCISDGSRLKEIAKDEGIDTIKELFNKKDTPILTIPLSRVVSVPKGEEILCYLGAYFRRRGFSANKRREIFGRLGYDLRTLNEAKVMNPDSWVEDNFLNYEDVKDVNFDIFDVKIRDNGSEKEFKDACRQIRNSLIPKFPFCIVDEAHNYKNPWVIGHKLFDSKEGPEYTLNGRFKKFLFLTATPFQLGHEELLNILRMFKVAETCSQGYEENLKALETQLKEYTKKIESLENLWNKFSRSIADEDKIKSIDFKDISECEDPELVDVYNNAIEEKNKLQVALKQYIVRNTKDKRHRKVFVGACSKDLPAGLDIPDKDKPLFYSLLRLQDEIEQDESVESKSNWLTDSMVTSTYSTLKDSKMLKSIEDKEHSSMMIGKYQRIVNSLIPKDDSNHPKVSDLAKKVVERYFMGEKSLIFTFYVKTAETLRNEIKRLIEAKINEELKKNGVLKPDKYKNYISEGLTKSDDLKYLALHENLGLTYSLIPDIESIDFDKLTRILGRNGFHFGSGKVNYKILLRAYEHYVISQSRRGLPYEIAEIVSNEDYVHTGLRPDIEKKHTYLDYEPKAEHITWLKESRALKYLMKGPNIWQNHIDLLCKVKGIDLRRNIQSIIISELLKSEFIVSEFAREKLSEEAADETWLEVICETYREKEIFNRFFQPETTCKRVERWIKRVIDEYEHAADPERIIDKLAAQKKDINPTDVSAIHGGSDNRSAYFDAFNSPFKPNVLICTSIGSEGIDLQHECSAVFLYDLGWNPSAIEQKIGRIDRIGSKNSRELEVFEKNKVKTALPTLEVYRPFIKGTRDERMHRVLQHREKWFNFILGSGKRLSDKDDENGDFAQLSQIQNEEEMLPLPDSLANALSIDLSV